MTRRIVHRIVGLAARLSSIQPDDRLGTILVRSGSSGYGAELIAKRVVGVTVPESWTGQIERAARNAEGGYMVERASKIHNSARRQGSDVLATCTA